MGNKTPEGEYRGIAAILGAMSDYQREELWPRMKLDQKHALWKIPPAERWPLLPPSERRTRSRCCCDAITTRMVVVIPRGPGVEVPCGKAKVCSTCWGLVEPLKIDEQAPPEFTAEAWRKCLSMPGDSYGRFHLHVIGGELLPVGFRPALDDKKAAAAGEKS